MQQTSTSHHRSTPASSVMPSPSGTTSWPGSAARCSCFCPPSSPSCSTTGCGTA